MGFGGPWSGTGPLVASGLQVIGVNGAELDIDTGTISGGNFPEIIFWNTAHTDYGKISLEVSPFSANQMLLLRSPAEPSPILPGNPLIQMRFFMTSFLQLGDVKPPNTNNGIGGQLVLDEGSWSLGYRDNATQTDTVYIRSIENQEIEIACGPADQIIMSSNDPFSNKGIVFDAASAELRAWGPGQLTWTALTLQNGWTAKAGYYIPSYRYTPDGLLELRGTATGGATADNTIICLMPETPTKLDLGDPHISNGGGANKRFFYNTDGKLYIYGVAGATDIGFQGNRFMYK